MSIEKSGLASTAKVAGHGGAGNALAKTDRSKAVDGAVGFASLLDSMGGMDADALDVTSQASNAVTTEVPDANLLNDFLQPYLVSDFKLGLTMAGTQGDRLAGNVDPGAPTNNLRADTATELLTLNGDLQSGGAILPQPQFQFQSQSQPQSPSPLLSTATGAPGLQPLLNAELQSPATIVPQSQHLTVGETGVKALSNLNAELQNPGTNLSQPQHLAVGAAGAQSPASATEIAMPVGKNVLSKPGTDAAAVAQRSEPAMSLIASVHDAIRQLERPEGDDGVVPLANSGKLAAAGSGLGATGQQVLKNARSPEGPVVLALNSTMAVAAAAASGEARGQGSEADRAPSRAFTPASSLLPDGTWTQYSGGNDVNFSGAPAAPEPSAFATDVYVAEQVNYWVSKDVQNAKLTLDGFGPEPVEVSISMSGNEATVDFRTDQPEVRQVLESAASHLKDLLSRQGMVLSGVSVGTSSQDASGSQQRKNQTVARQTKVEMVATAVVPTTSRMARATGNALDLFV